MNLDWYKLSFKYLRKYLLRFFQFTSLFGAFQISHNDLTPILAFSYFLNGGHLLITETEYIMSDRDLQGLLRLR